MFIGYNHFKLIMKIYDFFFLIHIVIIESINDIKINDGTSCPSSSSCFFFLSYTKLKAIFIFGFNYLVDNFDSIDKLQDDGNRLVLIFIRKKFLLNVCSPASNVKSNCFIFVSLSFLI